MEVGASTHTGSRALEVISELLLFIVVAAALGVGVYAIRNPNGIEFAPWPVASEMAAVGAAGVLGVGVRAQRRRSSRALFALGCGAAILALLMLLLVAFVLSFNQL